MSTAAAPNTVAPAITPAKLDSVTWLDTTRELRRLGMDVTLLAAGQPAGRHSYHGIEVVNIPRPEIYFVSRLVFHLRVLLYLLPRLSQLDFILFHPISAIWLFPLRLAGRRRPRLVMDLSLIHILPPSRWASGPSR